MKTLILLIAIPTLVFAQTTTYDSQGRVVQRENRDGYIYRGDGSYAGRKEYSSGTTYDQRGHVSTREVRNGDTIYTYDSSGKLVNTRNINQPR